MFDWLKNISKEYPEFYRRYLQKFESRSKRFVVLAVHASGTNPEKDVIFSLAALGVLDNAIQIGDSFEVLIPQYKYMHDNSISMESILESQIEKRAEPQALEAFLEYLGNSILVGYRIDAYVDLINQSLIRMGCGKLRNEALDLELMHRKFQDISQPVTLEEMIKDHKLPDFPLETVSDQVYIRSLLFLKLKIKLGIQ